MLNNETWLAHSHFQNFYDIHLKPWVKNLGWVSELLDHLKRNSGWVVMGPAKIGLIDYIDIVEAEDSFKKIYCYHGGTWKHIYGPILFVFRKTHSEAHIVGYAIPKDYQVDLEADPWTWDNLTIIDCDPEAATFVARTPMVDKKTYPVFFLSNGETNAEVNWNRLLHVHPHAIRVDRVPGGRHAAFMKMAELAGDSPRFFVVTAKNWVTKPEIFHYTSSGDSNHIVFGAKNMSNGLENGHMGIVLYDTEMVKKTPKDFGLDFTQWNKTTYVPIIASEATFATTPFEAWRTAFRECVKLGLAKDQSVLPIWENYAYGPFSDSVLLGAREAKEFLQQCDYDEEIAQHSEDWDWLKQVWFTPRHSH